MGRKNKTSKRKKNKNKCNPNEYMNKMNFIPEAGVGCHIVRLELNRQHQTKTSSKMQTEILGWDQDIAAEDFKGQHIPDICFDPNEDGTSSTLTVCNVSSINITKVAYVTVYEVNCYGKHGQLFQKGTTTDNDGNTSSNVVTFIVLIPPMTFCTLCEMILTQDQYNTIGNITSTCIESDVQEWKPHPNPSMEYSTPIRGFPLEKKLSSDSNESFLCTQGMNGQLTHYFLGNLHAIDFQCDIGTPVLAVEDGVIVDVKDGNTLTGISALNMFEWNSILMQHEIISKNEETTTTTLDGVSTHDNENNFFYTEYVHIQSAIVQVGDKVQRGDRIGYSGSVGFSPEPHLHFAIYLSGLSDAATVGFWFQGSRDSSLPYQPVAGKCYDASGPL